MTPAPRRTAAAPRLAAALLLVAAAAAVGAHGGDGATVQVRTTSFRPYETHVEPGGTVSWAFDVDGHNVVADDERFDSRIGGDATQAAGSTFDHTFGDAEEVVRYHCTVHGGRGGLGMSGVVVVGDPVPDRPPTPVLRVPSELSLQDAVAVAEPGDRIELAPGSYTVDRPLELDVRDADELPHGVTLVGTGNDPWDVSIGVQVDPNRGLPSSVLRVTGAFVSVENLHVDGRYVSSGGAAVAIDGATQVSLHDVEVDGGGFARDAVRITAADGAGLRGVEARNARRAGIAIEPCDACGVRIEDVTARRNLVGVLATGATGVLVRGGEVRQNAAGVVSRADGHRPARVTVTGVDVTDNVRRTSLPAPTSPDRLLATGAGIWLDGTEDSRVTGNRVTDNTFGIVLSGRALRDTVRENALATNDTGLAWDGIGAGTCFEGHGTTTTSPPWLTALHPCDQPAVGVPYPPVDAALVAAAHS